MSVPIQISILSDNLVASANGRGEHGLAFWIRAGDTRILFDAGQGLVLEDNARAFGVNFGAVSSIVLSHGHYDHTGGLATVLPHVSGTARLFAHPDASQPRYSRHGAEAREIGMPRDCREAVLRLGDRLVFSRQATEVAPGIRTTGEIPRRHPEEAITEPFYRDAAGLEPDSIPDDQALFLQTAAGTVVLLGCAHAGLINTLDAVQDLTREAPLRAVIGGTHLRSASDERIAWTMGQLARFNIPLLCPMHCTGQKAAVALWSAFPSAGRPCGVGTTFDF